MFKKGNLASISTVDRQLLFSIGDSGLSENAYNILENRGKTFQKTECYSLAASGKKLIKHRGNPRWITYAKLLGNEIVEMSFSIETRHR